MMMFDVLNTILVILFLIINIVLIKKNLLCLRFD